MQDPLPVSCTSWMPAPSEHGNGRKAGRAGALTSRAVRMSLTLREMDRPSRIAQPARFSASVTSSPLPSSSRPRLPAVRHHDLLSSSSWLGPRLH